MPPIQEKVMILYVSRMTVALGALLAQLDEKNKERVLYYINRKLVG